MAVYIALVHKDEGTSYGVSFPDVPGGVSAGDTFEEAMANVAEALAGHFALMKADGEAIPAPRSFEQLKRDPDSADGPGGHRGYFPISQRAEPDRGEQRSARHRRASIQLNP